MYPTSTLVATGAADRRRQAQTARAARAARRLRSVPLGRSRRVRAAVTQLISLATVGRANGANEYVRP
jgi:hypothetical protein